MIDAQLITQIKDLPNYVSIIDALHPSPQERSEYFYQVHQARLRNINVNRLILSDNEFSSKELSFLAYINEKSIDGSDIGGYWTHTHNIDYGNTVSRFLGQGLLDVCDNHFRITLAGKEAVKSADSIINDASLEKRIIDLLNRGYLTDAYKEVVQYKRAMPAPSGLRTCADNENKSLLAACGKLMENGTYKLSDCEYVDIGLIKSIAVFCIFFGLSHGKMKTLCRNQLPNVSKTCLDKIIAMAQSMQKLVGTYETLTNLKAIGVKEYQIVITYDDATCETCQSFDMRVFNIDEATINVNSPPFCVRCRCAISPYSSDIKGVKCARDANGRSINIPADMTYKQWALLYR